MNGFLNSFLQLWLAFSLSDQKAPLLDSDTPEKCSRHLLQPSGWSPRTRLGTLTFCCLKLKLQLLRAAPWDVPLCWTIARGSLFPLSCPEAYCGSGLRSQHSNPPFPAQAHSPGTSPLQRILQVQERGSIPTKNGSFLEVYFKIYLKQF